MSTPAFENLRDHQGQADMDKPIFNRDRGESVQVLLDRITELEQQLAALREAAVPLLCFAQVIATSKDATEGSRFAARTVLGLDVVAALDEELTTLAQEGEK